MDAVYTINGSTLEGLANAIRKVNGESKTYTPTEMIEAVTTIMDSVTYILVDENGTEIPAIFVDSETVFTATANDIRAGLVAANADGVVVGTKEIPSYNTTEGVVYVPVGSALSIKLMDGKHNYTKLQAIICNFNSSTTDSVAAVAVCIADNVYLVSSTESVYSVTTDDASKTISLGITNTGSVPVLIRYFTYKEEN